MLKIYPINNGALYKIRLAGPRFTWTPKIYNLAREAMEKTFRSEAEAQAWIDERL